MFTDLSINLNVNSLAEIAMVIFLGTFLVVTAVTLTRPRKFVHRWSKIPLDPTDGRKNRDKP